MCGGCVEAGVDFGWWHAQRGRCRRRRQTERSERELWRATSTRRPENRREASLTRRSKKKKWSKGKVKDKANNAVVLDKPT